MNSLLLDNIRFNENHINSLWLSSLSIKVRELKITKSALTHYSPNAFDSGVFSTTLLSLIIDNSLNVGFHPLVFTINPLRGLLALNKLLILNSPSLRIVDSSALEPVKETLTDLRITRIANTWHPQDLLAVVNFSKLANLDLQLNNLPIINSSSFIGVSESLRQLSIVNSRVHSIETGTFDRFRTLQNLYLGYNMITSLPAEVFMKALTNNKKLRITLLNNKLHCDCDLFSLQDLITKHVGNFQGQLLKCFTPPELSNFDLVGTELCSGQTSGTNPTTYSGFPTSPPTTTSGGGGGNLCQSNPHLCTTVTPKPTTNRGKSVSVGLYE